MPTENMTLAEHWTNWIARKSHPTHFISRQNRSSYSPKTNTEVLYDGSPEARAILGQDVENTAGAGVLRHALAYLKGKDVENIGMWTRDIMEPLDELEQLAVSQMVMDRSAVAVEGDVFFDETGALVPTPNLDLVQIAPAVIEEPVFEELRDSNEPTPPRC